jgi:hypothetical protein
VTDIAGRDELVDHVEVALPRLLEELLDDLFGIRHRGSFHSPALAESDG